MPERSKFVEKIFTEKGAEAEKSFTSERQHTAQAFNLHVERKDGRSSEGFAWSHYAGYQWTDESEHERLVVMFGMRAVEILGHNLAPLVAEIRDGQLNSIRELASGQVQLLQQGNPDNQPIIQSVKSYPDFEEVLREMKGEEANETRFTKRIER